MSLESAVYRLVVEPVNPNCVRPPNVPRSLTGAVDAASPHGTTTGLESTTRFKYSRRGLDGGCPSADAAALVELPAITARTHVTSETIALLENPAAPWVSVGLDQHNDIRLITPLTRFIRSTDASALAPSTSRSFWIRVPLGNGNRVPLHVQKGDSARGGEDPTRRRRRMSGSMCQSEVLH